MKPIISAIIAVQILSMVIAQRQRLRYEELSDQVDQLSKEISGSLERVDRLTTYVSLLTSKLEKPQPPTNNNLFLLPFPDDAVPLDSEPVKPEN